MVKMLEEGFDDNCEQYIVGADQLWRSVRGDERDAADLTRLMDSIEDQDQSGKRRDDRSFQQAEEDHDQDQDSRGQDIYRP